MREQVIKLIVTALADLKEEAALDGIDKPSSESRLFGGKSGLDSLNFVILITDIEERINDEFGKTVTLADERAMSQSRSPFRRVRTLADHIIELLTKEPDD